MEHVESDQTGGISVSSDLFPFSAIYWMSCQASSHPTRLAMSTVLNSTQTTVNRIFASPAQGRHYHRLRSTSAPWPSRTAYEKYPSHPSLQD
jgi:hypothetical protein